MSNLAESIQKALQAAVKKSFDKKIKASDVIIERPKDESHGDYATNVAMQLSKELGKNPRDIAQEIIDNFSKIEEVESIEVAGAGFINIKIAYTYYYSVIKNILNEKAKFGSATWGESKTVVVEYSSPNIAKPFTIGHLRSTIIGDAVANLLEFSGWDVKRDNHLGDWGTQFGKLIYAIKEFGDINEISKSKNPIKDLVKLYVEFHKIAEEKPEIVDEGREWFKKLEEGDKEARKLWKMCIEWSLKEFNRIYEKLEVTFTENNGVGYGESFFEDKMKSVIEELDQKKILKESDGAKLVFFDKQTKFPPMMIVKKNGTTLYATRDLATDRHRLDMYGDDILIINEVGSEQELYFKQLFKIEEMLGWVKPGQRVHKKHGLYRFKDRKISTRKGDVIWLDDVLEEAEKRTKAISKVSDEDTTTKIAIGAMKWNDLKRDSKHNIVFDWDELLNLQGNSSPYIQYTYTRANSILKDSGDLDLSSISLDHALEISLAKWLERFPEIVELAARNYAPNYICEYVFELGQRFNKFYNELSVLNADTDVQKYSRLQLTQATAQTIQNALSLLGIQTVEKM